MKEQFDNEQFSQFLNEQLQREAEEIEKELEEHPELADLSPDDSVKDRLYAQIEEYETQKALSKLSEKDRELSAWEECFRKSGKKMRPAGQYENAVWAGGVLRPLLL